MQYLTTCYPPKLSTPSVPAVERAKNTRDADSHMTGVDRLTLGSKNKIGFKLWALFKALKKCVWAYWTQYVETLKLYELQKQREFYKSCWDCRINITKQQ